MSTEAQPRVDFPIKPGSLNYDPIAFKPIFDLLSGITLQPEMILDKGKWVPNENFDPDVDVDSSILPIMKIVHPRLTSLISDWEQYLTDNEIPPEEALIKIIDQCNDRGGIKLTMPTTPSGVEKFLQDYQRIKELPQTA